MGQVLLGPRGSEEILLTEIGQKGGGCPQAVGLGCPALAALMWPQPGN